MKTVTATQLRSNIFKLLDEVLESGIPIEIVKNGKRLRIVPLEKPDKMKKLRYRPQVIAGDANDLPGISWEDEVHLDLP